MGLQTVFWVASPVDRSLGVVRLLGQPVTISVRVARVDWVFGDGATQSTTSPGKAYSSDAPCDTTLCPGYFGHVYRNTGSMQVTATVTWTGQYRIGNGAWQSIPGTVSGAASTTQLRVREARGVLVPDPTTH